MEKVKVLFVCIHNSARSQMAEAFLKLYGKDKFEVESAGIEPGSLNPIVVEAMMELGIDISNNKTKNVNHFIKRGNTFNYVITVCDETSAEQCPVFPGKSQKLHWGFRDPSGIPGTKDIKLKETRIIRDEINKTIENWVKSFPSL